MFITRALLLTATAAHVFVAKEANGAPSVPRVLLQRGDTGPTIRGQVSAISQVVGIDAQGRALVSFTDGSGPAIGLGASRDTLEVRVRGGTVLPSGGEVGQDARAHHLLPSGAYLVSTSVFRQAQIASAVVRVSSTGALSVVLDCGLVQSGADAALREEVCANLPELGDAPPRHDEQGGTLFFQRDPSSADELVLPVYFPPSGDARRVLDVRRSDDIPGLPPGYDHYIQRLDGIQLDGAGSVIGVLSFANPKTLEGFHALVRHELASGVTTILTIGGSNLPGVPAGRGVQLWTLGEPSPSELLLLAQIGPAQDCTTDCRTQTSIFRRDGSGAFTSIWTGYDAWMTTATGAPPHVSGVLGMDGRYSVMAIDAGVVRFIHDTDQPPPGRPTLSVGTYALPRPSPSGSFVAVDYETPVGMAVSRFERDGEAETLLVTGDTLDIAGEVRTVARLGLYTEVVTTTYRGDWMGLGPVNDDGVLGLVVRLDGGALGNNVPAILIFGPPPDLIVNSAGDASQTGSGAACDTGATIANGDPECTLRAAIELANLRGREADIGFDLPEGSVISPSSALPMIGVELRIHADAASNITVDGSNAGAADGLLVVDARLELEGLGLRNFGGDCVQAAAPSGVKLSGVSLESCGGIGVFNADGPLELAALGVRRSVVSGNAGGGVVARGARGDDPLVRVRDTTVELNGPVGVASSEDIWLQNVTVQDHEGPGVLADLAETSVAIRPAVYFEEGEGSVVARNDGVGVGGFGAVVAGQPVDIDDNASWGVAAGRLVIGSDQNPQARRSRIQGNGRGPVCHTVELGAEGRPEVFTDEACAAGGAWLSGPFTAGESLLFDVDVAENAGPGVFSHHRVDLGRFTLTNNEGEGLVVENLQGGVVEASIVIYDTRGGPASEVSGNQGVGLESRFGRIAVSSDIRVTDNAGWGIFSYGTVGIGQPMQPPATPNLIARNGLESTCVSWALDDVQTPPRRYEEPCSRGGIAAMSGGSGRSSLAHTRVEGNGGPGLYTGHAFELVRSTLTENDGPGASLGDEYSSVPVQDWVAVLNEGTVVTNNAGPGIYLARGTVNVPYGSDLRVEGNAGAGIVAIGGGVQLANSNAPPSGQRIVIRGNGGGTRCRTFHTPERLLDVIELETPCQRGGLWTEYAVEGTATDVIENQGDGIYAERGVTLRDSRVCRNSGQQIVSANQTLSEVDLVCADLPDPDPSPDPDPDPTPTDDEGGCRCVAPGAPSLRRTLALLFALSALPLAVRPRRR